MENEDDYDEENEITDCPNCGREYDQIDIDYLICSHCWYDAERKIFTKLKYTIDPPL